jgi:hypothetical protein
MYAASVPSFRKTLGAAAIGITLLGTTVSSAFAQERLASTDSDRATYSKCDAIKDHAKAAGCYTQEDIQRLKQEEAEARARGAAANKAIAKEEDLAACLIFLKGKKNGGTAFDRPITRDNACNYAKQLGMGAG